MLSQILSIAGFVVVEAVRNRLSILLMVTLLIITGLAEFAGSIAITEGLQLKAGLAGALLRLIAVAITSLFIISSQLRELQDKNMEFILALPLPRSSYYFGKLLGFSLVAIGIASLSGLALLVYTPALPTLLWTLSLTAELLIITALSLLFLFTFQQITSAFMAVVGFYLLARIMGTIQLISHGPLQDDTPLQHLLRYLIDAIAFVIPDLYRFTNSEWLIYHTVNYTTLYPILGQTLVYLVLLISAGLFDFYRKNL